MFPSADDRARLRRHLLARGHALATALAELLAGGAAGVDAATLAGLAPGRPGVRPEERLRQALDQVEARRALLDAGDPRYGRCDACGAELGLPALVERPWIDRCHAHAA